MMLMRRRFTVGLLLAGALALGGCESDSEAEPEATPQSQPAAAPQSEPVEGETPQSSPAPEEPAASTPVDGDNWLWEVPEVSGEVNPDGPGLLFSDMRVGEHTDYYRVVFEFWGEGTPGWFGEWSDIPTEQGRGEPLPVEGEEFLELFVTGIGIPMEESEYEHYYDGPQTVEVGPISVAEDGTFEGQTHFAIGMDGKREVQVGLLQDPVRVVLDIRK